MGLSSPLAAEVCQHRIRKGLKHITIHSRLQYLAYHSVTCTSLWYHIAGSLAIRTSRLNQTSSWLDSCSDDSKFLFWWTFLLLWHCRQLTDWVTCLFPSLLGEELKPPPYSECTHGDEAAACRPPHHSPVISQGGDSISINEAPPPYTPAPPAHTWVNKPARLSTWAPVREQACLIAPHTPSTHANFCLFSMHCLLTFNLSDRSQPNSHSVRADVYLDASMCVYMCVYGQF